MADVSLPVMRARSSPGTAMAAMMLMIATTINSSIKRKTLIFLALHGSVLRKRKLINSGAFLAVSGVPRASRVPLGPTLTTIAHILALAADPRRPGPVPPPRPIGSPTHPQCDDNWLMIENSGRYIEMTMPPTMTPSTAIEHRLEHREQAGDGDVDFLLVELGDFAKHRVESARAFAGANHLRHHVRKHAGRLEGRRDRLAAFDAPAHGLDADSITAFPAVSAVMSRPSRIGTPELVNVPRVRQNRATAIFRKNLADERHLQQDPVDSHPAVRRRVIPSEGP